MSNNRLDRLDDLAFNALLRSDTPISTNSKAQYAVLMEYKLKKETPLLLQAIADANPILVKKLVKDYPKLALAAGTVTTASGFTYEKVTAFQLAYLMGDIEICKMMISYIKKCKKPKEPLLEAYNQLLTKMDEVNAQTLKFKPFDFVPLCEKITNDQSLQDRKKPNAETEAEFAKLKKYFQASKICVGKSFIKEQLLEACKSYDLYSKQWNKRQQLWFSINVIGHIQGLVEECFAQISSQGFQERKPLKRSVKLKNISDEIEMTYRGSSETRLLGRDYFVDFYQGKAGMRLIDCQSCIGVRSLEYELSKEKTGMIKIKQELEKLQDPDIELIDCIPFFQVPFKC